LVSASPQPRRSGHREHILTSSIDARSPSSARRRCVVLSALCRHRYQFGLKSLRRRHPHRYTTLSWISIDGRTSCLGCQLRRGKCAERPTRAWVASAGFASSWAPLATGSWMEQGRITTSTPPYSLGMCHSRITEAISALKAEGEGPSSYGQWRVCRGSQVCGI
jgi:hypothetical protein